MSRNSPAPDANNEHSSPPASLSPLSSRFAAEAEKETIRRLRQECRGLATALGHLKRSTKEWALIKSKLDIANEELACVLEDRTLFRSFTGDGNDAEIESDEDEQSFPTPPLGNKQQAVGCDELASRIRTPPLMAKPDAEIVDRGIAARDPRADDTPEKYSLEWFRSRMKDDATPKQGDALNQLPDEGTAELSVSSDNSEHHSKSESSASSIEETNTDQQNGDSDNLDIDDLSATLKTVPKFSLEWFEIRQAITDQRIQQQQSDDGNFAVKLQSSAPSLDETNEQNGVIGHLNRKLKTVPRYSSEWFEIRQSINDLRIQQQNDGCYSNLASACACSPSGSGNRERSSTELRVLHLSEQLKSMEKFSLDWFQAKKEVEELKRLGDRSRRKPPN